MNINKQIAYHFAPKFLESLHYGESQINVWFPGSGKTLTTKDIISDKKIIKKQMGTLGNNFLFVLLSCDLSEEHCAKTIFKGTKAKLKTNFNKEDSLDEIADKIIQACEKILKTKAKEVVFILNKLEELPVNEQEKVILTISKIVGSNQRRIHSIVNCENIFALRNIVTKFPFASVIVNKVVFMPVIKGELLDLYLNDKLSLYQIQIDKKEVENIKYLTGGILFLTKELIRSYPDINLYEFKLKSTWENIPDNYKNVLIASAFKEKIRSSEDKEYTKHLKELGVLGLGAFKDHLPILQKDTEKIIDSKMNKNYKKIYDHFKKNKNKLVTKDQLLSLAWGEAKGMLMSDWAIDQKISRFRKELKKFGIDPDTLKTIKGRGYKWST